MGAVIADWQLPISNLWLAIGQWAIGNRQSKIGNVGTHPLPRTVLTSLPLRGLSFKLHHWVRFSSSEHGRGPNKKWRGLACGCALARYVDGAS
jgi:hypothetical protein